MVDGVPQWRAGVSMQAEVFARMMRPTLLLLIVPSTANWLLSSLASAADAITHVRKGSAYEDVRTDLENAIIQEGLKIDHTGNIAAMLERTGPEVGSNQPVYRRAEFFYILFGQAVARDDGS